MSDADAKRGRGELAAHSRGLPANSQVLLGELRRRRERNRLPPRAHRRGADVTRRERARTKFTGKTADWRAATGARARNGRRRRGLRRIRRCERLSREPENGVPAVYFGELDARLRRHSSLLSRGRSGSRIRPPPSPRSWLSRGSRRVRRRVGFESANPRARCIRTPPMTGESGGRRVGVTCAQAALRPGDAATSTRSLSATRQARGRARSLSVNRLAPRVGLEPTTNRLTAGCSTIELSGKSVGNEAVASIL